MKFKILIAVILISIFALVQAQDKQLKPFSSDGCSAFPDGTFKQNQLWLSCCIAHDLAYWKGGTSAERENADLALKECVASVAEEKIAALMLAGVRIGGSPLFPTTFRWGYGWSYPKFYGELTPEETEQVNKRLEALN